MPRAHCTPLHPFTISHMLLCPPPPSCAGKDPKPLEASQPPLRPLHPLGCLPRCLLASCPRPSSTRSCLHTHPAWHAPALSIRIRYLPAKRLLSRASWGRFIRHATLMREAQWLNASPSPGMHSGVAPHNRVHREPLHPHPHANHPPRAHRLFSSLPPPRVQALRDERQFGYPPGVSARAQGAQPTDTRASQYPKHSLSPLGNPAHEQRTIR